MPGKDELMLELLKEVRSDQKEHSNILIKMQVDVKKNKDDLEEHMAQTRAVRELVLVHKEEFDARIEKLEEPRKAFSLLKKYIIGLGAVATAALAILKFFDYI